MIGVVLMTYGAPAGRDDVAAYLARVRGGKEPSPELVAEFVSRYERIGWSPLVRITAAQAAALEGALACRGHVARVVPGMRFSEPSIGAAVATIAAAGARHFVGVCLSPQWSPLLMGGYASALEAAVGRHAPGAPVAPPGAWYREPAFVGALARRVAGALEGLPEGTPVILSAHSLPRRVFDAEPAYVAQLRETAALVAAAAGLAPGRWHWAYQSAGHTPEEWLRPDLKELFPALATAGATDVLVAPVQFLADHLEVLYDLDVAAAAEAAAAGLRYHRTPMPNASPDLADALARVVEGAVAAPA